MNWIIDSVIVFFSSVALYLFLRKSQLKNIPNTYNNLAMFLLPSIILFFINIFMRNSFLLPLHFYLLIFIAAFFFSYLGNIFSLISIKDAPNPGYINAVNAASISLLTLLSAYFFKDELSIKKVIGVFGVTVGLILLFF